MIRSWIKTGAAGIVSRCLPQRARSPLVVGYHRVVEDFLSSAVSSIPSMLISLKMLEQHLDWIGRRFHFVSLDELGPRLEAGDSGVHRLAAVTFDDGYRDFYEVAFPFLMRKGIPAALFVSTGFVGTRHIHTHDRLYSLFAKRPGNAYELTRRMIEGRSETALLRAIREMENGAPISEDSCKPFYSVTWEMLRRMQKCGITIGSHTRTHIVIPNESRDRAAEELNGSRAELETRLGSPVQHFAYPGGFFDDAAVKAVSKAGYRFAYTACSHRNAAHPQLTVPRILLWENSCKDSRGAFSESMMRCHAHRVFDVVSGCRQHHSRRRNGSSR